MFINFVNWISILYSKPRRFQKNEFSKFWKIPNRNAIEKRHFLETEIDFSINEHSGQLVSVESTLTSSINVVRIHPTQYAHPFGGPTIREFLFNKIE